MTINKYQKGNALVYELEGRLDTTTTPELENDLMNSLDNVTELVFDFSKLDYITSAGLRALLYAYKAMRSKGTMKVTHVNEIVQEVLDVTGFSGILNIE